MSERPEHVKCENCCYWIPTDKGNFGTCQRHPPQAGISRDAFGDPESLTSVDLGAWPEIEGCDFCGEFSAEWPMNPFDHINMTIPRVRTALYRLVLAQLEEEQDA